MMNVMTFGFQFLNKLFSNNVCIAFRFVIVVGAGALNNDCVITHDVFLLVG